MLRPLVRAFPSWRLIKPALGRIRRSFHFMTMLLFFFFVFFLFFLWRRVLVALGRCWLVPGGPRRRGPSASGAGRRPAPVAPPGRRRPARARRGPAAAGRRAAAGPAPPREAAAGPGARPPAPRRGEAAGEAFVAQTARGYGARRLPSDSQADAAGGRAGRPRPSRADGEYWKTNVRDEPRARARERARSGPGGRAARADDGRRPATPARGGGARARSEPPARGRRGRAAEHERGGRPPAAPEARDGAGPAGARPRRRRRRRETAAPLRSFTAVRCGRPLRCASVAFAGSEFKARS